MTEHDETCAGHGCTLRHPPRLVCRNKPARMSPTGLGALPTITGISPKLIGGLVAPREVYQREADAVEADCDQARQFEGLRGRHRLRAHTGRRRESPRLRQRDGRYRPSPGTSTLTATRSAATSTATASPGERRRRRIRWSGSSPTSRPASLMTAICGGPEPHQRIAVGITPRPVPATADSMSPEKARDGRRCLQKTARQGHVLGDRRSHDLRVCRRALHAYRRTERRARRRRSPSSAAHLATLVTLDRDPGRNAARVGAELAVSAAASRRSLPVIRRISSRSAAECAVLDTGHWSSTKVTVLPDGSCSSADGTAPTAPCGSRTILRSYNSRMRLAGEQLGRHATEAAPTVISAVLPASRSVSGIRTGPGPTAGRAPARRPR